MKKGNDQRKNIKTQLLIIKRKRKKEKGGKEKERRINELAIRQ